MYRAIVTLITEPMDERGVTGEGWQDHGEINRYTGNTLPALLVSIERHYSLAKFETFENRLEFGIELDDGDGHRLEQYTIWITCYVEVDVDQDELDYSLAEHLK